jgi:hypothetical protein
MSLLSIPLLDLPGHGPESLERLLGPYPILQFAAAAIVVVVTAVGALAWLKGERWGKASAEAEKFNATQPAVQMYFDGPLKAIYETLNDIKGRQLVARLEIKDDFAVLLSTSRHTLVEHANELVRDHETNMDNRFRDLNNNVNALHTRIDQLIQLMGRVEGHMEHRRPGR